MRRRHSLLRYVIFAGIVFAGIGLSLLTAPSQLRVRVNWPAMGTVAAITFRGGTPEAHDAIRDNVQKTWQTLENRLSAWNADSELARLAPALAAQGADALPQVPPDVRPCYAFAFDLKRQSGGAFDPVIGEALRRTGFTRVSNVDLGAVAKGFAVDRAWEALDSGDLLLDLGGNLRARGGTWHTGVRDPFTPDAMAATFDLADGEAVATSGNYERFVERAGGWTFHDALHPRSHQRTRVPEAPLSRHGGALAAGHARTPGNPRHRSNGRPSPKSRLPRHRSALIVV